MGLLDEAIRDHLELKRSRGADPSEIARAEREALEPVFPEEPRSEPSEADPAVIEGHPSLDPEEPQTGVAAERGTAVEPGFDDAAEAAGGAPEDGALPTLGQETAELDMEAVLEQDARLSAAAGAPGVQEAVPPAAGSEDELIEWEMPGRAGPEPPPEPLPGQERLTFE